MSCGSRTFFSYARIKQKKGERIDQPTSNSINNTTQTSRVPKSTVYTGEFSAPDTAAFAANTEKQPTPLVGPRKISVVLLIIFLSIIITAYFLSEYHIFKSEPTYLRDKDFGYNIMPTKTSVVENKTVITNRTIINATKIFGNTSQNSTINSTNNTVFGSSGSGGSRSGGGSRGGSGSAGSSSSGAGSGGSDGITNGTGNVTNNTTSNISNNNGNVCTAPSCNGTSQYCSNGQWMNCAASTACNAGVCVPSQTCSPGSMQPGTICNVCNSGGTNYQPDNSKCVSGSVCIGNGQCVTPSSTSSFWVTAYYPEYSYAALPPNQIDFSALTHLISTAVEPSLTPPYADFSRLTKESEIITLAHASNVKVIIGIDGTGYSGGDSILGTIMSNDNMANAFVNTILTHARNAGYDGIDVDWESGVTSTMFTKLVKLLRNGSNGDPGLNSWTSTTPRGEILVSVGASDHFPADWNYVETNNYVDQWNFMMYSLDVLANGEAAMCGGTMYNYIGFDAPLYSPNSSYPTLSTIQATYDGQGTTYLRKTAKYWGNNGADINKLGAGVPFYGNFWLGNDAPGQTDCGKSVWIAPITYRDAISYADPGVGGIMHWDDSTKTPWIGGTALVNTGRANAGQKFYISFDNYQSMLEKTLWAKNNNLGGIMIWSLMEGYIPTNPAGQRHPLLKGIKDALGNIAPVCTAPACSGTNLYCSNGQWTSCSQGTTCNLGVCAIAPVCTAGSVQQGTQCLICNSQGSAYVQNNSMCSPAESCNSQGQCIAPDTVAPTATITVPNDGASITSSSVTVSGTSSDNVGGSGVNKIEMKVNSGSWISICTGTCASWSSTASLTSGSNTISIRATDASNNVGTTQSITITATFSANQITIYSDSALTTPWTITGADATPVSFASTEQIKSGTSSIKYNLHGWWGPVFRYGSYWTTSTIDPGLYSSIDFDIYPLNGSLILDITVGTNGAGGTDVPLATLQTVTVQPNQWNHVSLPMTSIDSTNTPFADIYIRPRSTVTVYLDEIKLVPK